jgi:nardilysin
VPELLAPPEDVCRLTNTDVSEILRNKAAAAAKGPEADGEPKKMNQWAQRMADRSAFCAAGCPCLKPGSGGPFKMPRLKK